LSRLSSVAKLTMRAMPVVTDQPAEVQVVLSEDLLSSSTCQAPGGCEVLMMVEDPATGV